MSLRSQLNKRKDDLERQVKAERFKELEGLVAELGGELEASRDRCAALERLLDGSVPVEPSRGSARPSHKRKKDQR